MGSIAAESVSSPGEPPASVLLRLATAYQASRALHVAARLGLADLLADGPRAVGELAAATATHAASLHRLLGALAAFGVFRQAEDGRFALAPAGEALRAEAPGSALALVLMYGHEDYLRTWGALEHCVRTGETAARHLFGAPDWIGRYARDPGFHAAYNAGMTSGAAALAEAVVAAYGFAGVRRVVDVGGGQGRLIATLLRAHPALRGTLLDRPDVVSGAAPVLDEAGVAERCELVGGDMFAAVPEGGDAYVISRVIHDWDDARAVAVLANCRRAMAGEARLLLIERILPEPMDASPAAQGHALADLNMLVRTGGRERTEAEYRALLGAAGLRLARVVSTRAPWSVVEGVSA